MVLSASLLSHTIIHHLLSFSFRRNPSFSPLDDFCPFQLRRQQGLTNTFGTGRGLAASSPWHCVFQFGLQGLVTWLLLYVRDSLAGFYHAHPTGRSHRQAWFPSLRPSCLGWPLWPRLFDMIRPLQITTSTQTNRQRIHWITRGNDQVTSTQSHQIIGGSPSTRLCLIGG